MKAHTYKLLYIVFLLAVMVGTMQAQSYIIEKADMNQGLESNDILCTAQDCNGVIYVGTGGGLYRFNGYNFETFPSESERGGGRRYYWTRGLPNIDRRTKRYTVGDCR